MNQSQSSNFIHIGKKKKGEGRKRENSGKRKCWRSIVEEFRPSIKFGVLETIWGIWKVTGFLLLHSTLYRCIKGVIYLFCSFWINIRIISKSWWFFQNGHIYLYDILTFGF